MERRVETSVPIYNTEKSAVQGIPFFSGNKVDFILPDVDLGILLYTPSIFLPFLIILTRS